MTRTLSQTARQLVDKIRTYFVCNQRNNHFKLNIKKVFSIEISYEKSKLRIKTSSKIHQPFPWVAIKYKDHNYKHLDNGFQDFMNNTWEIDIENIDNIDSIGVAASDTLGNSDVKIITCSQI